jgi:hypothetical protein
MSSCVQNILQTFLQTAHRTTAGRERPVTGREQHMRLSELNGNTLFLQTLLKQLIISRVTHLCLLL